MKDYKPYVDFLLKEKKDWIHDFRTQGLNKDEEKGRKFKMIITW